MKKILLFLSFISYTAALLSQSGKVYDNLSVHSDILNMDRKYAVYLPPDYESSERSYPVLYLLHGAGDDQTGWVQFGEILNITDKAIGDGSATPMIVIMPDANTGQRGYFNSLDGNFRYEDFFFDELMPHVEKKFRIKSNKQFRAVAGLSMGGGGSFMYALHRPDLFSSACPLSAYVGPLTLEDAKRMAERMNIASASVEVMEAYFKKHNALQLVENMSADDIKKVRWFIDCGDDDFLYEGNSLIHVAMRKKEVPHEFRVRNGGHTWTYWRESLPVVLSFISEAFHQ
ncbi:MAG: esterase family protein [Saprospiraceae bacterium]|nr:esterase family protein [Saprospiraceae bacterium]